MEILIPNTLFDCILNSRGLECFVPFDWRSVMRKRFWRKCSPEERAERCKKVSEGRKRYCDNCSPEAKAEFAERMRKGSARYWKNVSPEKSAIHRKKQSDGMKRKCNKDGGKYRQRQKEGILKNVHGIKEVIDEVPRINTYSGRITASEMASL